MGWDTPGFFFVCIIAVYIIYTFCVLNDLLIINSFILSKKKKQTTPSVVFCLLANEEIIKGWRYLN